MTNANRSASASSAAVASTPASQNMARRLKMVSAARAIASTPSASSAACRRCIGARIDLAFGARSAPCDWPRRCSRPPWRSADRSRSRPRSATDRAARRTFPAAGPRRAVDLVEHAVAEHAVVVEVVGDASGRRTGRNRSAISAAALRIAAASTAKTRSAKASGRRCGQILGMAHRHGGIAAQAAKLLQSRHVAERCEPFASRPSLLLCVPAR